MAAFGGYDQQQEDRSPTVFGLSIYNDKSIIDKTKLEISMWKSTLKVSIYPLIQTATDEVPRADRKNGANIFLSQAKARMFRDILYNFKNDPDKFSNYGVTSNKGSMITITNSKEFNKPNAAYAIVIRMVNMDGQVEQSYAYEFKGPGYYDAVVGFDEKTGKFGVDSEIFKYLELDLLITQLDEYVKAATNAVAFSTVNTLHASITQLTINQELIGAKLGINMTRNNNNRSSGYNNQSWFNRQQPNMTNQQQPMTASNAPAYQTGSLSDMMNG